MPTDWKAAYLAALAEQNPGQLPELCEGARRAINDRILETASRADRREREELEEALRRITLLLSVPRPPN